MCGFTLLTGDFASQANLEVSVTALDHRGPDSRGFWTSLDSRVMVGHNRLRVIDVDERSDQPFVSDDGRYVLAFNGEIYNYLELRERLRSVFDFRTSSDTEVLLAAFATWGPSCLNELIGMFAFVVWDTTRKTVFGARDRFGVKPLYFVADHNSSLAVVSEIKALHALGIGLETNETAWSRYLQGGIYEDGPSTFWDGVSRLEPGHFFEWSAHAGLSTSRWYRPHLLTDERGDAEVGEELRSLLAESVLLRFRSDVEVGFLLSGGLDSSLVVGLASRSGVETEGRHSYTFFTGLPDYDETPWSRAIANGFGVQSHEIEIMPGEIPRLAREMQSIQDEPYGGVPTIAMGLLCARARNDGVTVLLDGNGLDEGWAGYDYYTDLGKFDPTKAPVQGSGEPLDLTKLLTPEFAQLAQPPTALGTTGDPLRDAQCNDVFRAKLPRALRFGERASMAFSRELREPLVDHRLLELGLRQPPSRKIIDGQGKWFVRQIASTVLPSTARFAPERPVQTAQREWLASDLSTWTRACIGEVLHELGDSWIDRRAVDAELDVFFSGERQNSAHIWALVSLAMTLDLRQERLRAL